MWSSESAGSGCSGSQAGWLGSATHRQETQDPTAQPVSKLLRRAGIAALNSLKSGRGGHNGIAVVTGDRGGSCLRNFRGRAFLTAIRATPRSDRGYCRGGQSSGGARGRTRAANISASASTARRRTRASITSGARNAAAGSTCAIWARCSIMKDRCRIRQAIRTNDGSCCEIFFANQPPILVAQGPAMIIH